MYFSGHFKTTKLGSYLILYTETTSGGIKELNVENIIIKEPEENMVGLTYGVVVKVLNFLF